MIAASPAQKVSAETPVSAVASLAIKSNKTGAIFNPLASIRFMINLTDNGKKSAVSGLQGEVD